jgi:hypothetical protein
MFYNSGCEEANHFLWTYFYSSQDFVGELKYATFKLFALHDW